MRRALLIVACSCQQGGPQPKPTPPPPGPVHAILEDAAVISDAAPPPDVLKQLATDEAPAMICFAVSQNHHRVACVDQVDVWDNALQGTRGVKILGDLGDASSVWTYLTGTDDLYRGHVPERIDHAVLQDIRSSLAARHYEPFDAPRLPLLTSAIINGKTVRRHRVITIPAEVYDPKTTEPGASSWNTYDDRLEVQCGSTAVAIPLDAALDLPYGEPDQVTMQVSPFDDRRMLLEVDGHWGIEGESGTTRGAQLIDLVALCQR